MQKSTFRSLGAAAALLFCPVHPSSAQADRTPISLFTASAAPGVTVHGHAEAKAEPDVAYATITVTTDSRDQITATQTNASKASQVIVTLKKSGVADKDVHTSYYSVSPQYNYQANPPVRTGYQVSNTIEVTIRDLSKIGILFDKAAAAGATSVSGPQFDLADRQKSEGRALVAAVADARSKADLMAGAAGLQLGRLLSIADTNTESSGPVQPVYRQMLAASAEAAPSTPIAPQQITVTADVTEVFALDYAK